MGFFPQGNWMIIGHDSMPNRTGFNCNRLFIGIVINGIYGNQTGCTEHN